MCTYTRTDQETEHERLNDSKRWGGISVREVEREQKVFASSASNILIDVYLQKLLHTPQPHTLPCSMLCLGIYFYFYFFFFGSFVHLTIALCSHIFRHWTRFRSVRLIWRVRFYFHFVVAAASIFFLLFSFASFGLMLLNGIWFVFVFAASEQRRSLRWRAINNKFRCCSETIVC